MGVDAKTIQITLKTVADISDVASNVKTIQQALNQLKLPPELQGRFDKLFSNMERNAAKATTALNSGFKAKGSVTDFDNAMKRINTDFVTLQQLMDKIDLSKIKFEADPTQIKALNNEIKTLQANLNAIKATQLQQVQQIIDKPPSHAKSWQAFFDAFRNNDFDTASTALQRLQAEVKKASDAAGGMENLSANWQKYAQGVDVYKQALDAMTSDTGAAASVTAELQQKTQALEKILAQAATEGAQAFNGLTTAVHESAAGTQDYSNKASEAARATNTLGNEVDMFKNRVAYFFGLTNAVQLFKRAVKSAFETIKELDAVMTETAVVTKFDVSDMWDQLPIYTQRANELGVSIHSAYEAATLYYQQGLATNQVMAVSNETLKMARIAGLDAAEATDRMTNALRGFNMEINETTAQNVNDVYSALAAKTASNVDEISTAMTKVASLANNANMSFENTAAFLSQIIETTRESAETAGTALKTVIARFSEVKELYSQGELIGTDAEGEEVDVNKVSKALRVANIDLNEYLTGAKGLDEIFIELASKWDSLDITTQRYIATMAAGSRQQSRFIAMMSDYGRTTELVNIANNAAGESQQQFEKTLESLETKLAQLSNAWDTFLMGITNSDAVKAVIDVLTWLIEVVDKASNALPGLGGSITKVFTAVMLFKGGKILVTKAITVLFSGAKTVAAKAAQEGGQAFSQKLATSIKANGGGVKGADKTITSSMGSTLKTAFKGVTSQMDVFRKGLQDAGVPAEKLNATTTKLYNALRGDKIDTQALREIKQETGVTYTQMRNLNIEAKKMPSELEAIEQQGQALSSVFQRTGMAVMMLSGLLSQLGVPDGVTKIISIIGTALMLIGMLTPAIRSMWTTFSAGAIKAGKASKAAFIEFYTTILVIIAVVSTLVYLFSKLSQSAKANSIAGRMEAAEKATARATEEAKKAQEAYDNLLESHNKYDELHESLDQLTKGTIEWRQALAETNQQVLDLIAKYPTLSQFMNLKDGVLTISEEGWSKAEETQRKTVANANAAAIANSMEVQQLKTASKREAALKKFDSYIAGQTPAQGISGHKYEEVEDGSIWKRNKMYDVTGLERAMDAFINTPDIWNKEDDGTYSSKLEELAESAGMTAEELFNAKDSLAEYSAAMAEEGTVLQSQAETYLAANASDATLEYDYADQIITGFGNAMADSGFDAYKENLMNRYNNAAGSGEDVKDNEEFKKLAGKYNINTETAFTGDDTHDLQVMYAAMKGIALEDVDDDMSEKQLAQEIANMQAMEELTESMDKFAALMQKNLNDNEQRDLAAYMSGDFSQFSANELETLLETNDQGRFTRLESLAKKMGYDNAGQMAEDMKFQDTTWGSMSDADKQAYLDRYNAVHENDQDFERVTMENAADKFTETITAADQYNMMIQANMAKAQKEYDNALDVLAKKTGEVSEQLKNLSLTAVTQLGQQIADMGKEEANRYVAAWEDIITNSDLDSEQQDTLGNLLASTDLSDMRQMADATQQMQAMGIATDKIKEFWDAAANSCDLYVHSATEALALAKQITNMLQNAIEITGRLAEGKGTEADIQALLDAGYDIEGKLTLTVDGWQLLEGDVEDATNALKTSAAELAAMELEQEKAALETKKSYLDNSSTNRKPTLSSVVSMNTDGSVTSEDWNQLDIPVQNLIAKDLGLTKEDGELEVDYLKRAQAAYTDYISALKNGDAILEIMQQQADMAEAQKYTAAENLARGGSEQSVQWSAEGEVQKMGGDVTQFRAMKEALAELNPTLNEYQQIMIALANIKLNTGLSEIIDSYDDWTRMIDQSSGLIKATTAEDVAAFDKLKKSVNTMLNTSEDLSDEFWNNAENMKNLKSAAEGDTAALEKLQKAAAKDYLVNLDLDLATDEGKQAVNDFVNYLDSIDLPVLEAGVRWDDNGAQEFISRFNDMAAAANLTAEQIQESVRAMGFNAEIDWVEDVREVPNTVTDTVIDERFSPEDGGGIKKSHSVTYIDGYKTVSGLFPVVKTLTSNGSGGGGVSYGNKSKGAGNKSSGGGGGGGGSDKKPEYWDNKYDKIYNLQEQENGLLHERNRLEHEYNELLEGEWETTENIAQNYRDRVASLEKEAKLQADIAQTSMDKANNAGSKIFEDSEGNRKTYDQWGVTGAVKIDWETMNIQVDEDFAKGIENDPNRSQQGAALDAYVEYLKELLDEAKESQEKLWEIQSTLRQLHKDTLQGGADAFQALGDALTEQRQDVIDELSALNDSINDSNSRILEAMQQAIDLERQIDENTKKEEDIADKEARLAYLQRDTSGGNQLEILSLQKEIDDAREDYQNTLIDQAIQEMQNENDLAAQQREDQITLAQEQLDWWKESGQIWEEVRTIMDLTEQEVNNGINWEQTTMAQVMSGTKSFTTADPYTQKLQKETFQEKFGLAILAKEELTKNTTETGLQNVKKQEERVEIAVNNLGGRLSQPATSVGNTYKREGGSGSNNNNKNNSNDTNNSHNTSSQAVKPTGPVQQLKDFIINNGLVGNFAQWIPAFSRAGLLNVWTFLTKKQKAELMEWGAKPFGNTRVSGKAYATGGLNTYTGPAWLDGTPSKPEYVLNSEQTEAFLALVQQLTTKSQELMEFALAPNTINPLTSRLDHIYSELKRQNESTQNTNYFDITVGADVSESAIDRYVEEIKRQIVDDANYRNVQNVNWLR